MEQKLGTSSECLRRREELFQAVKKVEQDIEALNEAKRVGVEPGTMEAEPAVATRRATGPNPGPGRQNAHVPRSANLEQLYHQSLPMDKALSHSGPPNFGNQVGQHPVLHTHYMLGRLSATDGIKMKVRHLNRN